ncbi:unnamed protein product [Leuciscus chuanchicus]
MATVLGPNGDEVSVNLRFHCDRPHNTQKLCAISQSESPLGVEIHERQLHCQVVYVNIKRPPSVPSGAINPLARSRKGLKNALLMKVGWAQLLNQHSCFFTPVRHDQAAEILARFPKPERRRGGGGTHSRSADPLSCIKWSLSPKRKTRGNGIVLGVIPHWNVEQGRISFVLGWSSASSDSERGAERPPGGSPPKPWALPVLA